MIFPDKYSDNSDASTGFALFKTYELWSAAVKKALLPIGITHPQFTVMTVVSFLSRQETVSQSDVSAMSRIDPMTVSAIVRNLEKRGLLVRHRNTRDTRAWDLSLTADGGAILETAFPLVEVENDRFFSALDDEDGFRRQLLLLVNCSPDPHQQQ